MSDFMEVLYDPKEHTHESCIKEVRSCDMVILLIGSRYGGRGVPAALTQVDIEKLHEASFSPEALKDKENLSVTQLEICKAIEESIPVFAFVSDQVWHDHHVYEANKQNEFIGKLRFPSIEKHDTARYIFEFVNFLRHRTSNNSIIPFSRVDEIEEFLKRQWSGLFQRLLENQRAREGDQRRLDALSSELADLKAVIMSSIAAPDLRQTARGAIRFRRLIEFVTELESPRVVDILKQDCTWQDLLTSLGIARIEPLPKDARRMRPYESALVKTDGTFYMLRYGDRILRDLNIDWEAWKELNDDSKMAILDAVSESGSGMMRIVRYVPEQYSAQWIEQQESVPRTLDGTSE